MKSILLPFLLFGFSVLGQTDPLPFELERYEPSVYLNILNNSDHTFNSEEAALQYYYLAYKVQRAKDISNYFPRPDEFRRRAASFLNTQFPDGSALILVNFLESHGSAKASQKLIACKSEYSMLLPYQFLAAYLLHRSDLQNHYLDEMDKRGMLSDVLKSFGKNAVLSIPPDTPVITQGFQDLIAISFSISRTGEKTEIFNVFSQECNAYTGARISDILSNRSRRIWLSPTISADIKNQIKTPLYLAGTGFIRFQTEMTFEQLESMMQNTGRNFVGLNNKASNPAEIGLITAYSYFAEAYGKYAPKDDNTDKRSSDEITSFILNQKR